MNRYLLKLMTYNERATYSWPPSCYRLQCYFITDYQGNNIAVMRCNGASTAVDQRTDYYPYGEPHRRPAATPGYWATNSYLFADKEYTDYGGESQLDFGARTLSAPVIPFFTTPDPLSGKNHSSSPYAYCMGNPVNLIDRDGCDTIRIDYEDGKWKYQKPVVVEGDDVFIVSKDNNIQTVTFSEGEYGKRVAALNLNIGENIESYTLGIYHVSGTESKATGFYVAPGGESSNQDESGRRINDGEYPITAPSKWAQWQTPGVGGNVAGRGVRFHYGYGNARTWTKGCFILSYSYETSGDNIRFSRGQSINASMYFNFAMGANLEKMFEYKNRYGAVFSNPIKHTLILKSL